MKHFASAAFWTRYDALPRSVRDLADRNFTILKDNPRHPSLQVKKVGRYWSARVGSGYRAVAMEADRGLLWFWIGTHDEYARLISR